MHYKKATDGSGLSYWHKEKERQQGDESGLNMAALFSSRGFIRQWLNRLYGALKRVFKGAETLF